MGTCITSPVLGAVLSGYISNKCGGHSNRYPLIFAFFAGLIALVAAIPMTWVDDPLVAISLVWVVLFTGAFILPIMTGVMLTCVEQDYKSHANSMANMSYNLLGYLPAPTIYGMMNHESVNSRAGMRMIMYAVVPAVALIGVAILIRKPKKSNRDPSPQKK